MTERSETTDNITELAQTLHDFRQFVMDNAVRWKEGASHHNPMWLRVATVLDKHGANEGPAQSFAYYTFDPAYREESRQ
jgi:hypothetical protein